MEEEQRKAYSQLTN